MSNAITDAETYVDLFLSSFGDSRLDAQRILELYIRTPLSQMPLRAEFYSQLRSLYEEKLTVQFLRWDQFSLAIESASYLYSQNILLPGTAVTGEITTVDSNSILSGSNFSYVQENALTYLQENPLIQEGEPAEVESLLPMSDGPTQAASSSNSDMNISTNQD